MSKKALRFPYIPSALISLAYIVSGFVPQSLAQAVAAPDRNTAKQVSTAAPRLPDILYLGANAGKPDLGAETTGGKGIWDVKRVYDSSESRNGVLIKQVVPFTLKGKAIFEERLENLQKDDPEARCMPPGVPRMMFTPYPVQIIQLPDRVLFLYEGGTHIWRVVWLDGRKHPPDPNPAWLGDAIGHWDGDILVVDTVGFNDRTWLDNAGHPHGAKLHVIEKYSRLDRDTLHYEATIEDPDYYTQPWTIPVNIKFMPGQELLEYICQENNKDVEHLVGK